MMRLIVSFFILIFTASASAASGSKVCKPAFDKMRDSCIKHNGDIISGKIDKLKDQLKGKLSIAESRNVLTSVMNNFDDYVKTCRTKIQSCETLCQNEIDEKKDSDPGLAEKMLKLQTACLKVEGDQIKKTLETKELLAEKFNKFSESVKMVVVDINGGGSNKPQRTEDELDSISRVVEEAAEEFEQIIRDLILFRGRDISSLEQVYGDDRIGVPGSNVFDQAGGSYRSYFEQTGVVQ